MITKESTQDDINYRKKATEIADTLMNEIKQHGFDNFKHRTSPRGSVYQTNTTNLELDVPFMYILVHDYDRYVQGNRVLAGVKDNQVHIFYDTDENIDIKDNTQLKKTIVHEIIHIFDNMRMKGDKTVGSAKKAEKNGYESYVNDPFELNAHYQEMVHELDDFIERYKDHSSYEKLYDMFLKDPNDFIKFTLSRMDSEYIKALTPENLKKYKQRIYKYHQEIKDKIKP